MPWSDMLVNINSKTSSIISMNERNHGHVLVCALFGRVNGGLALQGFQTIAGNAVPLCHVLYVDKAGSTKHCSHHPIYGKFQLQILLTYGT
jgi:hypothetical protein